ncbi:hypothetical protein ASPZODRAFT_118698 [Penicilliopsis zonata CBS 506.65]|uniref:Zn(2)-C6 fungal-type domain-containing protein n=1 Tax=Penicilliopsis zonata CBS 506.65 TaxID=1073090 RepID=A0A1L9SEP5_9EURO|nr:hypothetical protein ASPZODRAFT_118698 [Penicilliopsis zonata CBS 506.65]OJJ45651.1 hypothetical protein ASPZODRAFT_118698 [Penicilliopsis zonata CBS 506.65]
MEPRPATAEPAPKRPRSPSGDFAPIASKVPKTHSNHLQINYLARQYPDNLPLVSTEDTMPAILRLVGDYDGVLHRHESIAGNLGACPLGPILIKRFERLFDGPPRVLKSHGKDAAAAVTWLDVVEFAKNKPEQFNLEKTRNGVRVCQFYTKQCRVEISEEDFVLIASGMPQKMIPPQPIIEDEEKELGALEILEKNLQQIIQMADQVSARARQLNHRLKNRRTAIVSRRENDASLHTQPPRSLSPSWKDSNGTGPLPVGSGNGQVAHTHSPPSGFVAVNAHRGPVGAEPGDDNNSSSSGGGGGGGGLSSQFMFSHSNAENITIINGTSIKGASPTTRAELMKKFFTTADRHARGLDDPVTTVAPGSRPSSRPRPRGSDAATDYALYAGAPGTVAIPNTPSSLLPPPKSTHYERDDGGPYKLEMVARMEELQRGERILPPCDRCRRLHMDCLKNLTACMGCTKKHAKCSWKDVKEDELHEFRTASLGRERDDTSTTGGGGGGAVASASGAPSGGSAHSPGTQDTPIPAPTHDEPRESHDSQDSHEPHEPHELLPGPPTRGSSAPSIQQASESQQQMSVAVGALSPRRAISEVHGSAVLGGHDRQVGLHHRPESTAAPSEDDDPDANQRLMQAILDTVDHHTRVAAAVNREGELPAEHDRDQMVKA